MKNIKIFVIILITILVAYTIIIFNNNNKKVIESYKNINTTNERESINNLALPLVYDYEKYIEKQTREWIDKRDKFGYCYGLLEKDKIIMAKWMEMFKINSPVIHYYNYHTEFTLKDLQDIVLKNKEKDMIIKITHLQSSYGIILVPSYNSKNNLEYLDKIYQECLEKFKTCFVCNHDKNNPPTEKEISRGLKNSHYRLYETIEPGIIIQDFFYSKEGVVSTPRELKILVYGDKIIDGLPTSYNIQKYKYVIRMARDVSKLLGASLIRVDVFVKEKDNPYIPYLNEISLSPNGGFETKNLMKDDVKKYQEMLKNYKPKEMEINELIKNCPKRSIPIKKYLSDADLSNWYYEKFKL